MRQTLLTWPQRGRLWLRLSIRLCLFTLLLLALWKLVPPLLGLLAPFVFAFITAVALNPLVRWTQKRLGIGRKPVAFVLLTALMAGIGGLLGWLAYCAAGEAVSLAQNWEGLLQALLNVAGQLEDLFTQQAELLPPALSDYLQWGVDSVGNWFQTWAPERLGSMAGALGQRAMGIPSFLLALLVFVMGAYFLTSDYPYLRTRVISHMDESLLRFLGEVKAVALAAFGGYLRAQLLLSVGVFFILLAGFLVTGQGYGLLLALGLAVLDFIPILGSGTVMVPWAMVALVTQDYTTAIQVMVIWGIVVVFRRAAEPKVVGDQTGLSPVLSLVAIYAGMKLAGVGGMILGPIAAMVGLNLVGLGVFRGLQMDFARAMGDLAALLRERDEEP